MHSIDEKAFICAIRRTSSPCALRFISAAM
jgi:hypothetical protein